MDKICVLVRRTMTGMGENVRHSDEQVRQDSPGQQERRWCSGRQGRV